MRYVTEFDVIVVGGGHAGTEAALASARSGASTMLLTQNIETIGQMSCNPAIGGIGKSHLVREIDAMGGVMAEAADHAGIQFRTLNARKGPAVRATRAQADRQLYRMAVRGRIENQPGLTLLQQDVVDLLVTGDRVEGVVTGMGIEVRSRAVILTVGTFLGGIIHVGMENRSGGRAGDPASNRLAERLRALPFRVDRLKTGTPPRIDGNTLDYKVMEAQPGDQPVPTLSYMGSPSDHPRQIDCHITRTNERTHDIIRASLDRSPLFTGKIDGIGPRYCPSIEDKVVRFSDRNEHQIFIEPEGLLTSEIYPNGISTSLPFDVQIELVHSIRGMERAHITRPGYAIEYDFFDPRDLRHSLETRFIRGLFFAGQINGTTGYEEAAAQGLLAGINASRLARDLEPWVPRRDQAYIGVMVDDLITQGTREPYRMFTSRAEYRLLLRQDNADQRLTPLARELGLIADSRWDRYNTKMERTAGLRDSLSQSYVRPGSDAAAKLNQVLRKPMEHEYQLLGLLRRPELTIQQVFSACDIAFDDTEVAEKIEIETKYEGYIARQEIEIDRIRRQEELAIPQHFDFGAIPGLSTEVRQKLIEGRPVTVGQAGRIAGVTRAALSLLLIHLRRQGAA